jgi:hypothetical protein
LQDKTIQYINEANNMLWKRNLDLNTNVRADAKHVRKENIAKNTAQRMRGDAGVPDGIMNCTAYTVSQTL